MAEQTILSVSLNEYKNQIKDIQASMLGLERTSEEYQKAAQKAAEMQNKLNTVLGDSRKGSDYAADSINALTVKYRDLHNELMKMSPNDAKFKEMAAEAKKLGDEINARKQDMSDFTSNIGHYSEGIISAFNTMGVSIKGLGPAFNLATAGAVGFKGALTTLSAHPIMAVLVGFAALLMKVKGAISENAELSEKWKVAMASFEPIINAVKNALDWLATGLVNLVSSVTSNIPTVLRAVGNGAKTVFNIVGKIVDVIMFIPTKVAEVNVAIAKLVTAGLEKVAGGLADFLDTIGIDGFAQKLRNAGSSVANAAAKVGDGIIKGMKGAGDAVSKAGSVIDGWMNKAANAVTTTQNLQKEQNKLAADNRAMLEKEAQFEKTQADLRLQAAKTNGEERAKILKQINENERKMGEERVAIAKRQASVVERLQALSPTDTEGKNYLAQLKANATKAEAAAIQAQVRNTKQITNIENKENKAREASAKASGAAAEKAAKEAEAKVAKATAEAEKKSKELVKKLNDELAGIGTKAKGDTDILKSEEDLLKSAGLLTPQDMVKYNEEIYNINKKAVDEELKLLQESVNNTEISENDKLAIYNRINAKTLEAYAMTQKHQSDINKLNYDIFKTQADEQIAGIVEFENNKKEVIIGTEQQTQIELAKQYVEGNITFEEYQKGIVDAADKSKLEQLNIAKDMTVNLSEEAFTEAELLKQQFGEDSQYYIDAYKRYQESLTAVSEAETNVRLERAKQEIQQKNETKKHNEDIVKSYQAMAKSVGGIMGTVSDIMEDNIDQKVKNGEISEEQAKEEFERVKKLQIGETIVNTITGAVGAFMQDKKSYPAPYNYIIAGIDMASTLATGIAQINQIKSQEYGSSSSSVSGGSVSNSGVSVMPLLDENQDVGQLSSLQTANNTGTQTDNRVYILQSDITDSNNQVDIRENNTTY